MIYRIYKPVYPLSRFIDFFFYYEGYQANHRMEKLLPDGSVDLLIDLTEGSKKLYHNEEGTSFSEFKKSWISGMKTDFILIDASVSTMFGVHFKPGGCFPFVNFQMAELNNITIELDTIWGTDAHSLREVLLHAAGIDERFSIMENYLLEKGKRKFEGSEPVNYTISQLLKPQQEMTIEEMSCKIGFTQKHLISLFKKYVGLSPKMFSRIIRFQHVIRQIEKEQKIDWTSIAYDCAYYDQAHFIKEFRAFSGINPSSYLLQRGEHLNYLPVNG